MVIFTKRKNSFSKAKDLLVLCCKACAKCSSVIRARYLHKAGCISPMRTGSFSYIIKKRSSCSEIIKRLSYDDDHYILQ